MTILTAAELAEIRDRDARTVEPSISPFADRRALLRHIDALSSLSSLSPSAPGVLKLTRDDVEGFTRSPRQVSVEEVADLCDDWLRLSRLAAPAGDGWRDIASAPRDGTLIWVACEFCMRIASWSEDRWRDFHGEYPRCDVLFTPTNWQPLPRLPAPPSGAKGE